MPVSFRRTTRLSRVLEEGCRNRADVVVGSDLLSEAPRHGADAAFEAGVAGQEGGLQAREPVGVGQTCGIPPVRRVDLLLDAGPVKRSEGKSIDGEDVVRPGVEKVPESRQRLGMVEGFRGLGGQPQPDSERALEPQMRTHPRQAGGKRP